MSFAEDNGYDCDISDTDTTDYRIIKIVKETNKAYLLKLVKFPDQFWIPKSVCDIYERFATIHDWFMDKKKENKQDALSEMADSLE